MSRVCLGTQTLEHVFSARHERAPATGRGQFLCKRGRIRPVFQLNQRLGRQLSLALARFEPRKCCLGIAERSQIVARHISGKAPRPVTCLGQALAAAQRSQARFALPHRLPQPIYSICKLRLNLTCVLQFGFQPSDRGGSLGSQILPPLFKGCDSARFEIIDAGREPLGIFFFQAILRDRQSDRPTCAFDAARGITDLLRKYRKRMPISEGLLRLMGATSYQRYDLFEHFLTSMYEQCS